MNITFTRTGECTYTTQAMRGDGVTLQVPGPDRTAPLPHDLAHYVVERELGLRRGFWGRIADGALFPGLTVVSGRQPPHAAERSRTILREVEPQGTHAEVLVGIFLGILHDCLDSNEPAALARVSAAWTPGKPERGPLDPAEVRRVCQALQDAQQRWQALAIGQSLAVWWPRFVTSGAPGGTRGRVARCERAGRRS